MFSQQPNNNINQQLAQIDKRIDEINNYMTQLEEEKKALLTKKGHLIETSIQEQLNESSSSQTEESTTNYNQSNFRWSKELKNRMRSTFGIENFRFCQEGVCNAFMENRDIICVMPTGGGKSLTYQLPALFKGCTVVISPLIALINDQVHHLRQQGIKAVKLTSAISNAEIKQIYNDLYQSDDIKLCYVTPERLVQSKELQDLLMLLVKAEKLVRFVIDEAHCISEFGHDFRPHFKQLSLLRLKFPEVPILALSATCPLIVLNDLLQVLQLSNITDGAAALQERTVYFSAPLYRSNLQYKIMSRSEATDKTVNLIANWILKKYPQQTGIIYCLTKKDVNLVATTLSQKHDIKTGFYHSQVEDKDKETLHNEWRTGKIQVVCATIAFGLGIDKENVRFVIHYSMPKSLDGFYQESGRAGRDGLRANCILLFRPQDVIRVIGLVKSGNNDLKKIYQMADFALNKTDCRKLLFSRYFNTISTNSPLANSTIESEDNTPCGHCDNCTQSPDLAKPCNLTLEAWKICKVVEYFAQQSQYVTMTSLARIIRGATTKDLPRVDLNWICSGKISQFSQETIQLLIIHLIIQSLLHVRVQTQSRGRNNVYIVPGQESSRLTQYLAEDIERRVVKDIEMTIELSRSEQKQRRHLKIKSQGDENTVYSDGEAPRDDPPSSGDESVSMFVELQGRHRSDTGQDGMDLDDTSESETDNSVVMVYSGSEREIDGGAESSGDSIGAGGNGDSAYE